MATETTATTKRPDRTMKLRIRPQAYLLLIVLLTLALRPPLLAAAGAGLGLERQLQEELQQSKILVRQMIALQQSGGSIDSRLARLKGLADAIAGNYRRLRGVFDTRRQVAEEIGPTALARHTRMADDYQSQLPAYLDRVGSLPDRKISPIRLEELENLLEHLVPDRNAPLLGALPYRHLQLSGQSPLTTPALVPAFLGGNKTSNSADRADSPDAPITKEIAALVQSLDWSPVAIYAWVKNNIKTELYWGSMKGAAETLRQGSGNDADQAALLVALFRAAGFPARFVRGTVEFFPNLSAAENLTGLSSGREILAIFQQAGIPCQTIIAGGRIANLQVEHIWVEAEIPYANYRGAVIDEHGKSWLGLDTFFKVGTFPENEAAQWPDDYELDSFLDHYLAEVRDETPLELLPQELAAAGADYQELLSSRTAPVEELQILPASLQFKTVAVTGEYAALPEELSHLARFVASADDATFFDLALPVRDLASHRVAVTYEPVTVEDQEIINSYGGLDNTPAYLVRLRPVLTVDGERRAVGTGGLAIGDDFDLGIDLLAPGGHVEHLKQRLTIGNLTVLGFSAQGVTLPAALPLSRETGEHLLYERAMDYLDSWNRAEDELASLLHLALARPMPSVAVLGGVVDVVRLLDQPQGFEWKGVYIDADFRAVELAGGDTDAEHLFMQLSSLQASVLEHRIFQESFGVESISTAKLLSLANADSVPLVVIDQGNLSIELPGLNLPANIAVDIENAVYQGLTVTIPPLENQHEDWQGYGYLKENLDTGEAGWMLSGMIAGGMTALNPDRWPAEYYDLLANPFVGEVNHDPDSAVELRVLAASENQEGTVGRVLKAPLQVIARDAQQRPVSGVVVNFQVLAGGGTLSHASVTTDSKGIASVDLTLGQHVGDNPTTWYDTPHSWTVGENLIDASTTSGLRLQNPITAYGFPDEPHHLKITGGGESGEILSWSSTVRVRVEDRYNNSISNVPVTFSMGDAQAGETCAVANSDSRPGLLVSINDPCLRNNIPAYGDCGAKELTEATWDFGSAAQVILGGVPAAVYPVTIKTGKLPSQVVTIASNPFGNCAGDSPPQHDLVLKDINLADNNGNIINASPVGGTIPLKARMYMVSEGGVESSKVFDCNPGSDTCPVLLGNRQYTVDTAFTEASVRFAGQEANALGNGLFELPGFKVGDVAGKQIVTITGKGSKKIWQAVNVCSAQTDCSLQGRMADLADISLTKEVYAVDIELPQAIYIIPIDQDGYATADTMITYTIQPAGYTAGNAMVELAKKIDNGRYEPISYLDSERSGNGFVSLARGFRFDHDTEYVARVILNKGSNSVEIASREIAIKPIALDLRADLNRDGNFLEDDPLESFGAGLVVPLNADDDDGDGIEDRLDGYNADGIIGPDDAMADANGNSVPDDDLVEIKLTSLPKDLAEGRVVLEVLQGRDKIRIWASRDKGAENILIDAAASPPPAGSANPRKEWEIGSLMTPTLGSLPQSLYIEGVNKSLTSDDTVTLVTRYIDPNGKEIECDRLLVTVYMFGMIPDYNRDGKIDDMDRGKVIGEEPWRFWVNDDNDGGADADGIGGSANDLPGRNKDNGDNLVNTIRDLVDFFPLHLDLNDALRIWPRERGYEYILKDEAAQTPAEVGLAMLEGVGARTLTTDKAADYLEVLAISEDLVGQTLTGINAEGVKLSNEFLDKVSSSAKNGIILVEARGATTSSLLLEIEKDGKTILSVALPLEIVPVEEMFGHKNLRTIAGATDGDPDRFIDFSDSASPDYYTNVKQPFCMQGVDKSLVWMHGYNVDPEEARGTYTEVFKRFFHAGLTGRFYGVSWFGNPPALGTPHYHQAVVNGFATAGAYGDFINSIPGATSIAAHSLGNMVAGLVIQDHGLTNFASYFAIDAAVALEAYGQTAVDDGMVTVGDWLDYWKYETTDSLGNIINPDRKLLASEWHERFPDDDHRSGLTWRKRLLNVPSDKVYNFYSGTEDVLRSYPGDDLFRFAELVNQGLNGEAIAYLATSTWVKQEKFKGRRSILNIFDNLGGVSSSYCGWSFSRYWNSFLLIPWKLSPQEAAGKINTAEYLLKLQSEPFFAVDNQHLFPNPLSLLGPGLDELASDTGSEFVDQWISETNLKSYYTSNRAAQGKVKVKDWLLAEAFPATTLPMGANYNDEFSASRNIDMSGVRNDSGGCCKTDKGLWPESRRGEWWHSDYKNIAYQHVFTFYDNIANLINSQNPSGVLP